MAVANERQRSASDDLTVSSAKQTRMPDSDPELHLEPSLEEARELAARGNVVPIRARFVDDCETPVSAFLKVRAGEPEGAPCFLLESAEQGQVGRYSFVGVRPRSVLRWSDGLLSETGAGDREAPDPYAAVAERLASLRPAPVEGLPPFSGGAVGYFGYDLVRTVEPLGEPNPDPLGLPDMALMLTDVLLVFDHLRHELTIMACALADESDDFDAAYEGAARAIAEVRERLRAAVPVPQGPSLAEPPRFASNMEREEFEAAVQRIVEYIRAGDAFQVVPSQRFSAAAPVEAFSIYRGLRAVNPSPYMYFLDFGDFQIAGASPEPLVKVSGSRVETRPIAGTYPRGANEEEDRRLAERLVNDPKERAEHVMLVDLGRNDLGRVCEYGTVTVDELMVVETYSHVLHIVSQVSGTLREGVGAMDVLRSALPAGTLSGAPKVRAMQIIDELEPVKRCSYGGAIGYLSWNGDLDTAIHIRTVVVKDGQVHVQAGGGTVADAEPTYEYNESVNKARAVFQAVELACSQPDWR
jgi:anthranilate synthase component I